MRVISFNIKGAAVPGKKDRATQERSWHLLAAYDADLALVQEVELACIPQWARTHWTIVHGNQWKWGSVIAARPALNVRPRPDLLRGRLMSLLLDYGMVGEVELPDGAPALVASVHAPARKLREFLRINEKTDALASQEMMDMAQPGDDPWAIDLFFATLASMVKGHRFIVGGDWNNSRLFDLDDSFRKPGKLPFSTMFFTRAKDAGWFECHGSKNEERTFLDFTKKPHQLDHLFCDHVTAERLVDCCVRVEWVAPQLSDHAPLVTDFEWT